jgi:endonuclease/exonuclease/phosphatase family metal-dependent hydrolase
MVVVTRALLAIALCGCGLDLGPVNDWIEADTVPPPLALETEAPHGMSTMPLQVPATLRVVTFNVMMGADPAALAEQIRANAAIRDAGVYLIQEEEAYPKEGASRTRRLAAALGLGYVYVPGRTKDEGTHGLAILSRFPIEDVQVMNLRLASQTPTSHQRIAISAMLAVGDVRLPIVDVHLETTLNIRDRILQLRPAVIDLPPVALVAGDFNTNPYLWEDGTVPVLPPSTIAGADQAPILDDYMRSLGFATPAADIGPTESKYGISSRLDAIFTRGLPVTPARVERGVAGSDHWPVWVDVTLP